MNEDEKETIVSLTTLTVRLDKIEETLGEIKGYLNGNEGVGTRVTRMEERLNGTWKTLLILGWLLNLLVAVAAVVAAILLKGGGPS